MQWWNRANYYFLQFFLPLLCFGSISEVQGEITWQGPPFFLVTRGMGVADILRDFGANYAIPVVVSPQIEDVFVGTLRHEMPEALLRRLAQLFTLVWYHDGEALYVYKAHEVRSKLIAPNYLTANQLARALQLSGVLHESGCAMKLVPKFNAFEIFGVPTCIQRVTALVRDLDARAQTRAENQQEVRIFPLKYASATDTVYHYRQQQVTVPGVVTLLREMRRTTQPPVGEGDSTPDQDPNTDGPYFSADVRQNAVVVHDRAVAMPMYTRLIQQLDQRAIQVEISVAIIDVNVADLALLGVDWQGGGAGGPWQIGTEALLQRSFFSAVLNAPHRFMLQVQALQQRAKAKVLSQPSIVTLNNVQAILDKNITFYSQLISKEVAKLETITTGTLLKVTPRVIHPEKKGQPEILLQLNIQDGQPHLTSARQAGKGYAGGIQLPIVRNSEITTQATLKAGQSLLLGGFVQDQERMIRRSIPLLGSIPIIGLLFSNTHREINSVVRLFLIKATPLKTV